MGYLIAYLLLTLVVDLLLEVVAPMRCRPSSIASHRRLWSDSLFDCRSRVFSLDGALSPQSLLGKANRHRLKKEPCAFV